MKTLTTLLALSSVFCADSATESPAPQRPWTLMIYGAADNNADGPILEFLDDVRVALDDDPGVELLLFIDRSEGFSDDASLLGENFSDARVYRLRKDSAERLDASAYFEGMANDAEYEVDSADPRNIASFVAFGKAEYPAQNYGLMIYSHANGCTMCPDDESGRSMSIPELTDWVDESASVDFLALELCNMAGLEIAYQWRPGSGGFSAGVLVAIPNAGPPLDWDRAFARIRSEGHATEALDTRVDPATMTALDFGKLVVEEGFAGRKAAVAREPEMAEHIAHEAAGCYDLTKAARAKKAVDALAVALHTTGGRAAFEQLRGFEATGVVMNYVDGRLSDRPYVDAYALLDLASSSADLSAAVRSAAGAAKTAVDELVVASFGMPGLVGFEPGKHGLFLVFPDGSAEVTGPLGRTRAWNRLAWYTPLEGGGDGAAYGRWTFLGDGAEPGNGKVENWFELLDAWYDDTSNSPAGSNGYAF